MTENVSFLIQFPMHQLVYVFLQIRVRKSTHFSNLTDPVDILQMLDTALVTPRMILGIRHISDRKSVKNDFFKNEQDFIIIKKQTPFIIRSPQKSVHVNIQDTSVIKSAKNVKKGQKVFKIAKKRQTFFLSCHKFVRTANMAT